MVAHCTVDDDADGPVQFFFGHLCVIGGVLLLMGFVLGVWGDSMRMSHLGAAKHYLEGFFLHREVLDVKAVVSTLAGDPAAAAPGTVLGVAAVSAVQAAQRPRIRRLLLAPFIAVASRCVGSFDANSSGAVGTSGA